jgi:hypothetical protein
LKKSLFILFFFYSYSFSQPAIQWQNTIGADSLEWFYSLQQTSDGGYILGGYSRSNIADDKTENNIGLYDFWLVKTDSSGAIQWQNTIGGSDDDVIRSVQQTADGGYILGGYSASNISSDKTENCWGLFDYWIVKTDALGNVQWENTIGGSLDDRLFVVSQTTDGGYILGGHSNSNISGDKTENRVGAVDYWIVKTNSLGVIQWQNTIGGTNDDYLYCLQQTTDGGYILGGSSRSSGNGDKTENTHGVEDYWIVKTDASGNIQWQNDIGSNDYDQLYSIHQTMDGGYILGGYSDSDAAWDKSENSLGWFDYWIVKTDATGNIEWDNTLGGDSIDYLYAIRQTSDTGYILGGHSASHSSADKSETMIGGTDYWIVKTDSLGSIQWENTIGGTFNEDCRAVRQTSDDGFIVGGSSYSNITADKTENSLGFNDYWIVKIDHICRVEADLVQNVLCFGDGNGTAAALATGGQPPYTYLWSVTGDTTQTVSDFGPGTYTVSVTDLVGCITSSAVTITEPPLLVSDIDTSIDLVCYGDTNAFASITVAGGTPPYTYSWNTVPVQTTTIATNLPAGNYTVVVTDANGCTQSELFNITEPPQLVSSILTHQDVLCSGGSDGSAKVDAAGGVFPYTYLWNTIPPQTTPTAVNLTAGIYTVTVTDANGCITFSSVTITEPAPLTIDSSGFQNITCNGGSDGSATVNVNSGTPPYTYSWNTGDTTSSIFNVAAGSYSITVLDSNGCTTSLAVVITEPPPITFDSSTSQNITCFGDTNGIASVTVNSGTPPFTYSWNTGDTTSSVSNLLAGTYSITVIDSNGCSGSSTVTITEPALFVLTDSTADATCATCCDGAIIPTVSGGVPPYTYTFSCGPSSTVCPGTYTCCVVDSNGCQVCDTVIIDYPTSIQELQGAGISITPNPAHDNFTISFNNQLSIVNAQLSIYDVLGKEVYNARLVNRTSYIIHQNFSPGIYLLKLTDGSKVYSQKLVVE